MIVKYLDKISLAIFCDFSFLFSKLLTGIIPNNEFVKKISSALFKNSRSISVSMTGYLKLYTA